MEITNDLKLPKTLINLYHKQRREYAETVGEANASATQLIAPPRIGLLRKKHYSELKQDVSERLWAILGTVIHRVMVDGADEEHIAEENLFIEIDGWLVKGGVDVQRQGNRVKIIDYKFTKSFKYQKNDFSDWEEQLNIYAYMVRKAKGYEVDELEVVMFVRDFSPGQVKNKGYPPASVVPVPITLWPVEKQEAFIRERITIHKDARRAAEWGEPLPKCSDLERWKRESDYAVMKPGGKRATKVCANQVAAEECRKKMKKPDDYEIVHREDDPTRCLGDYCGVAGFCEQWAEDHQNPKNAK